MEKEKILSTLNEKIGNTNFSEKTLNDYVDAFIPESEENPDFDKHANFLKSLYGNFSADVAKQVNDFKKNYKPEPAPQPEPPKPDPQPNKEIEELKKTVSDLTKRLDEKESKLTQEQLLSKVREEMKKQGANDDYVLGKTLQGVSLDAKKSVADLAKEMLAAYDSEYTACRGKGAAPRNGEQGGNGNKAKNAADDFFARKMKRENWGNNQNK